MPTKVKKDEEIEIEYLSGKDEEPKEKQDEEKRLKRKLRKKEAENRSLKKDIEKIKADYLRQLAEKENIRKRFEKEKSEYYDYALSDLLRELLEVLDNYERALGSQDEGNGKSFREGVQMIYKQYRDLLFKQGVTPIDIEEKQFDPHLHQAFMTEEADDVEEPEVSEELQKGYKLHNRLLRPSLVKVRIPKKDK